MKKLHVTYFFRKPRPQYFSIEKVFDQVIVNLPDHVISHIYKLKNGTNGWWGRVRALIEVRLNKGIINHITGDITFIALALPKKGLVVTYHDLESFRRSDNWIVDKIIKIFWIDIPVRRAEYVTCISEHTKNKIIEWTGCDPDKIVVVPNPLPEDLVYTPKAFNKENPTILVMGTKANKNVQGILKAVGGFSFERDVCSPESEVRSAGRDNYSDEEEETNCLQNSDSELPFDFAQGAITRFKLIVVGKMSDEQKGLAEQYNLEVENLVHVPYDSILDAYKRCDVLCFPSFYEGFGLPIIEAQAIGRPVITSNFGAMKEVAGEGAILVDPYCHKSILDGIYQVFENKKRAQLIIAGNHNLKRFRADLIGQLYNQVYSKL